MILVPAFPFSLSLLLFFSCARKAERLSFPRMHDEGLLVILGVISTIRSYCNPSLADL